MKITDALSLGDRELIQRLPPLARGERISTVELIIHLAEFDARRLHEGLGFRSTFQYCREVLRLSEDAAANRIEAARTARRYPEIVDLLLSGAMSPTTVRMLAPHLTDENHAERLAAASGKGKRDVEELTAAWAPRPPVSERIRPLGAVGVPASMAPSPGHGPSGLAAVAATPSPASPTPSEAASPSEGASVPTISAPGPASMSMAYEVRFMASAELRDKLVEAQDLLGHAVPGGSIAAIVERGLNLLLADLHKKRFGETDHPRPTQGTPNDGAYIPVAVRRAVWKRDGGRCAFVASNGRRCDARRCLEYHHVLPRAAGGRATVDNIQLRCRAHNGHEVERFFGKGKRYRIDDRGRGRHPFRNDLRLADSIRTPPRAGPG
jgi:hypothetical protein